MLIYLFARFWAVWTLVVNFFYIVIWTIIGIVVEYDKRHIYTFPEDGYRIFLWVNYSFLICILVNICK